MSRCWAVRERLGRAGHHGAAPTLPDFGRFFVLLCSPPGTLASAAPHISLVWALVGHQPFEGWGSPAWDTPWSPALVVLDHSWGCGLHPDTSPCSSALLLVLGRVQHLLWCRDGPEPWGVHGGINRAMRQSHLVGGGEPTLCWGVSLTASPQHPPLASLLPAAACLPPTPIASQS